MAFLEYSNIWCMHSQVVISVDNPLLRVQLQGTPDTHTHHTYIPYTTTTLPIISMI
jgi:hypothetical protein